MRQVVVVTSSSGMDYLDKPNNIRVLRLNIEIDDEIFKDGKDITFTETVSLMNANSKLQITTSPPTTEEAIAFFEGLYEEGFREVFMVCVSAAMSGTYDIIHEIKTHFSNRLFIHIFDSKTIAYSEARIALTASKMLYDNCKTLEVAEKLALMCENNSGWFVINDLTYMIHSGRVSGIRGMMANVFNIKPMLKVTSEGEVIILDKVRNINRAIEKMCEIAAIELNRRPGKMFIVNLGDETLIPVIQEILAKYELKDLPVFPTASTSVANHGPHGIGLGIFHDC